MTKVHSFDVFDTALLRRVAVPSDVFRLVGRRIAREIQTDTQDQFIEDFITARSSAEREALLHCEECTLDQIWKNLHIMLPGLPLTCGPKYELDAEQAVLIPNGLVAEQIAQLRAAGARIIFASDTYLPVEFVRAELFRHHLADEDDGFYVSSALGVTKRSGLLFEEILSREGLIARDMCHYGDNAVSDVERPRRLGITATLSSDAKFNTWERAALSANPRRREASSFLAGAMRNFRINRPPSISSSVNELVSAFLGPAALVWAAWVLGAARRDGVRRLYFVARDGHLVWRAARMLAPQFGNIDCRYLKISRQSILLPSADEISPIGMPWLQRRWEPARLERLIQKLGLDWTAVAHAFSSLAGGRGSQKMLENEREWAEFWAIVQNAPIVDLVRQRIQDRKTSTLAYLHAEGLFDKEPVALVDIGWHLMVQAGVKKLLGDSDEPSELRGYYLGLNWNRVPPAIAGPATALFYDEAPDRRALASGGEIFRRQTILEHMFGLAPHGTVRAYREAGSIAEPICPPVSETYAAMVREVEQAIEAFCIENRDCAAKFSEAADAREIMDGLIKAWCSAPSRAALDALAHVIVSDDPNNLDAGPLLERWSLFQSVKMLIPIKWHHRLKIKVQYPRWPEAALLRPGPWPLTILRWWRWIFIRST